MKTGTINSIYNKLYKSFGPQHWWPGETPFEVAVGAILTQNTNWGNVEKAIFNLKKAEVLSPEKLHKMHVSRLAVMIKPAGYFNIKAKRLKNFVNMLKTEFSGSMQKMNSGNIVYLRERLLSVNGIGPETADSILLYALEKPIFVVDAYTKRILSRHTIIDEDASYGDIQHIFHEKTVKDVRLYNEYHALLVRLAKDYCRPKPRCSGCPIEGI